MYVYLYTTLTPKIKGKGKIYLIYRSHIQVCNIESIAQLSVRYKHLFITFRTILKSFDEMVTSHQLYIYKQPKPLRLCV